MSVEPKDGSTAAFTEASGRLASTLVREPASALVAGRKLAVAFAEAGLLWTATLLALGFSFVSLLLAIVLWRNFDPGSSAIQFVERHDWIPSIGVQYYVGIDGLGLFIMATSASRTPR